MNAAQPAAAGCRKEPRVLGDRQQVGGALLTPLRCQRELDEAGALDDPSH